MNKIYLFIITSVFCIAAGFSSCGGDGDTGAARYYCLYTSGAYTVCNDSGTELSGDMANLFIALCGIASGTASTTSCVPSSTYCRVWDNGDTGFSYYTNINETECNNLSPGT